MIYIASPYTPTDPSLGPDSRVAMYELNYKLVRQFTAWRLKCGECVFSPIVHSHPLSVQYELPRSWDFWWKLDVQYLDCCTALYVLCIVGWEKSTGVKAEIAHAKAKGLPIIYWSADVLDALNTDESAL